MKIVVQFNSKSKGKGVAEAIKLAEKHRGKLQGNYYQSCGGASSFMGEPVLASACDGSIRPVVPVTA